jgi:hypothetical protein
MTTDNFWFYLQNRLIQTSQTGGLWYSDTPPFSIPCTQHNDTQHNDIHNKKLNVEYSVNIILSVSIKPIKAVRH